MRDTIFFATVNLNILAGEVYIVSGSILYGTSYLVGEIGTSGADAGTSGADAGTSGADAGTSGADAGTSDTDASISGTNDYDRRGYRT